MKFITSIFQMQVLGESWYCCFK